MSFFNTSINFWLYIVAAGWIVRKYNRLSFRTTLPLNFVISDPPKIELNAVFPKIQISFGLIMEISCFRYSWHVFLSLVLGTLLFGGLHFTIFVIYTSSLEIPASSSAIESFFPATPINGSPFLSSFLPGASPTKITSDWKWYCKTVWFD